MKRNRRCWICGGAIFILLLLLELLLRTLWGFGKMPLYAASTKWEYMTLPEQRGKRLGNNYYLKFRK